jgi:hypothetical protein
VSGEKKPPTGIPFGALFVGEGARDRAQQAYDNPRTPPELRAELARYLADPLHATVIDQEKRERALRIKPPGRPKGGLGGRTKLIRRHIRALKEKYPRTPRPKLYEKRDVVITGEEMKRTTFAEHERIVHKEMFPKK